MAFEGRSLQLLKTYSQAEIETETEFILLCTIHSYLNLNMGINTQCIVYLEYISKSAAYVAHKTNFSDLNHA